MKTMCLVLAMVCSFSLGMAPRTAAAEIAGAEVAHFFTHSLIAYPNLAFAKDNFMRSSYDADCVTVSEFKGLLQELYERDYVLVRIEDTYTPKGVAAVRRIRVPDGKKPLVLSFDDVNYYSKKMHLGMNDKLVVRNGKLATYTRDAAEPYNEDNEHVTVLENFIRAHPDFSYRGAKGLLCLTGFDGILGYRTQSGSGNREAEIQAVKPVVGKLKELGWTFACHSYGHYHMKKLNDAQFERDTRKWREEVAPLVGSTDIYCYPYGEFDIGDTNGLSVKQRALTNAGYRLFLGVGTANFYGNMPWQPSAKETFLLMDRKPFDGISMRGHYKTYTPYVDCKKVYDSRERFYPFPNV